MKTIETKAAPGLKMFKEMQSNLLCRRAARLGKTEADNRKARNLLADASRLVSSDVRPLLAASRLALSEDNKKEALDLALQAEKIGPGHSAVLLQKGEVLLHSSQFKEAEKAFKAILAQDKRNVLANNFLAFCHLEQGRTEEFQRKLAEEGLWHRPDLVRLAWTQQKMPVLRTHQRNSGNRPGSVSLSPPGADATDRQRLRFARNAFRKQAPAAALEALDPLADRLKTQRRFLDFYAELSIATGRAERACTLLQSQLKAKSKPDDAYFYYLLGRCRVIEKQYEAAVAAYEQGKPFTTMPYYTAMLDYYIALAELEAGRMKPAGEAIESACRQDALLASIIADSLTRLFCKGKPLREIIDAE